MADIRLAKPAAGASESVQCAPEARFVFDFPTTDATLARDGDNLTISFEDGGKLQLEGFYQEYNGENLPSFNIDGTEVAAADFFQAMNEPDLMPAAGPGTGTVANGARFHEWGDSALASGITHLNGLDWGFSRAFEWDGVPNAVGRNGDDWGWLGRNGDDADDDNAARANNPVTLTPENPGSVPPGTVVPGDGPDNPTPPTPGNHGIVPPGDVRLVSEAGLRDGGSVSVDGAMRVGAPDGLASIEVAGRVIWQNGHMAGNPTFATDEGYFHNFAYDAASGRLTYTYTLTSATQEHGQPGQDHIAHSLPLTVRDVDGDYASSNITIVIRDDVAAAVNDSNAALEGHEVTSNVLDNDTHGADGAGTFAGGKTVRWELPEGAREITDENGRACHELDLKDAGGRQYGTVRLYDDGSYTFKAGSVGEGWAEGVTEFSAPAIGYAIIDADGDIAHATLSLETIKSVPGVTPNPPTPEKPEDPKPGDEESGVAAKGATITVDEGALDGASGLHNVHGVKGAGTVTLEVNGEANGKATATLHGAGHDPIELVLPDTSDGTTSVSFPEGSTFTINGVDVTFTEASYANGQWTLSYSYELSGAQTHDQGEHDKVLGGPDTDGITITVQDASGDTATGKVTVEVHDDIPVVSTVTDAASTVQVSMGADTKSVDGQPQEYNSVEVSIKGTDTVLQWKAEGSEEAQPLYNANGSFNAGIYTAESDHGTVTLEVSADGRLTFGMKPSADGKEQNVELTVKAIDADGDEASADVKLSTPSVTPNDPTPEKPEDPKPGDGDSGVEAAGATIMVDEGALDGASGLHNVHGAKGAGTVTLEVNGEGDGKATATLSCAGHEDIILDLPAASENFPTGATFTINGVNVTFTGATYADGQWTLSYTYALDGAQTHDKTEHDKVLGGPDTDGITITVQDASGDTATGKVTVEVHDDIPVVSTVTGAATTVQVSMGADKVAVDAEHPEYASVEVFIKGTDTVLQWKAEGSDAAQPLYNPDGTFHAGIYTAESEYGTVTLEVSSAGSLQFGMKPSENGIEQKVELTVKAIDADGDTASADVKLSTPSVTPNKPTPEEPGDNPGDDESGVDAQGATITVDEGALGDGSGQHNEHGFKGAGTVTLEVNGEGDGKATATLSGNGHADITLDLPADSENFPEGATFNINGVNVTFTGATYADGQWTLSYSYELSGAQTHDKTEHDKVLGGPDTDGITITVQDASGDEASGKVTVEVHDDIPVIKTVTTNAVEFSFGADDRPDAEGSLQQVEVKFGDTPLAWSADGASKDSDISLMKDGETWTAEVTQDGHLLTTVTVSCQDGKYVFEYADKEAANPDLKLDVEITDADGDKASTSLSLATPGLEVPPPTPGGTPFIPATGHAEIVVDEGALTENAQAHAYHGKQGSGSFDVEITDPEGGSITLAAGDKSITLTIAGDGAVSVVPADASFTVNGVEIGGFAATSLGDGKWAVSYNYELTGAQHHDKGASDDVIFTDSAISITVTNSDGSEPDTGKISVEVHDDVPVISAVASEADGSLNSVDFSFGADDRPTLASSQQNITVRVGDTELRWTDGNGNETSDISQIKSGSWTAEAPLEGQVDADGMPVTATVSVSYQNGRYVFDSAGKEADKPDLKLDVQITDADGDTASASVYLGAQPEGNPDTPGNSTFIPATDGANIVVDEGALEGGSHVHDAHGKEGIGHFNVELPHAEGGSIVLTVLDADGKPVTLTISIAAASGEGQPAYTITGAESLVANGVELSEFQLVYNGEKAGAEGKDSWTVNYHYELTGPQTHGTDDTDQSLYKEGAVQITVTDGTGDVVTGQINIEVHDDAPLAVDDSDEVIRDHKPFVTGDLLKNDSFGADDRYATVEAGQAAAVFVRPDTTAYPAATANEDGSYTIPGKYGTLTLNADGTYSYKLDDMNEDVLSLGKNDHLRDETFDYQIIDGDGDVSTATLTINVAGNHGVTVTPGDNPTPGASSIATVYDAGLAGGNHEGQPHYATEVSKTLHIEAKDGLASIKVDGKTVWDKDDGFRENVELPAADGTLKITGYDADSGTLSYTYTLTGAATHGKPGNETDDRLSHTFTVEVTDTDGDNGQGTITVNVVDDAPVFTSGSYEVTSEPDFTSLSGINGESMAIDFTGPKAGAYKSTFNYYGLDTTLVWTQGTDAPVASDNTNDINGYNPTLQAATLNGSVKMTASFVHYRYVEEDGELHVDNVVDINNAIKNSAKALRLTGEGITVGASTNSPNINTTAWNHDWGYKDANGKISTDGEIASGGRDSHSLTPGKGGTTNFENVYGKTGHYLGNAQEQSAKIVDGDNVSEAIVFDLGSDTQTITAYGFKINLGGLEAGDRALLTFMLTAPNSSDDSIVKMVEIKQGEDKSPFFTKDAEGNYTISVPDGFTKVFVSALPKGEEYEVKDSGFSVEGTTNSSGFIIKSVDFLKATEVSSGTVEAISADNADLTYDWNWAALKGAEVLLKGENDPRTLDTPALVAEESNATFKTYLCKVDGVDLFKATIDTVSGEWTVTHYREFEMQGGKDPFRIDAKDSDGDVSTIDLELNPEFTRFAEVIDGTYLDGWKQQDVAIKDQADDILVGKDHNSLMYGKGGDDLLIGDRLEGAPAEYDAAGKTVEDLAARIANAATEKNLNDVAGDVTGDKITIYPDTKVDTLYKDINALTNAQKDLLGQELEGYEKIGNGDDALYGGQGNDLLFGAGGDDYLSGDLGQDIIYGGGGHDIILYDETDAYIDGGSGINILLAGKSADLNALQNQDNIRHIEVFIRSENTDNIASLGITSLKTLAQYGVSIDEDNNTIHLSGSWTDEGNGVYKNSSAGLQLATSLSNIGVVDIREANKKTGTAANDVLLDSAAAAVIGASLQNSYFDDVLKHHEDLAKEIAEKGGPKDGASNIFAGGGDDILFSNAQYGFLLGDGDEKTKEAIDGQVLHRDSSTQNIGDYIGNIKTDVDRLEEIDSLLNEKETDLEKGTDGADIIHGGKGSEILYGGGKEDHLDGGAGDDILIGGSGDDVLLGGAGDDMLFGGSGDDFLAGGAGKDSLFGGSGDDLIIYDPTDYLIDGGEGIDFLLSSGQNGQEYTLKEMIDNYNDKANADADMPRVNGVEVMIRGVDTTGLQNMEDLARECGFMFEDGKLTLGAQWKQVDGSDNGTTTTYVNTENEITLETTLAEVRPGGDEAGEQAAQTIVLSSNG